MAFEVDEEERYTNGKEKILKELVKAKARLPPIDEEFVLNVGSHRTMGSLQVQTPYSLDFDYESVNDI